MDFFAKQIKLQKEAHAALVQAKEMARMQIEVERQKRKRSVIADKVSEMVRQKVGKGFSFFCMFKIN